MTIHTPNSQSPGYRWRIFPGLAVIAIGGLFLLGTHGVDLALFRHGNWWAWFILIGALAPLTAAWERWRARGRIDAGVAHRLLAATAVLLVAAMFLLNLDWAVWWPLFVIMGGLFTFVPHHGHRYGDWHDDYDDERAIGR